MRRFQFLRFSLTDICFLLEDCTESLLKLYQSCLHGDRRGGDFCLCLAVWLPPSAQRLILEALLLSSFGSFGSLSHSISPTLRRRRLHSDAITIDEESNSTMAV